MTIMLVLSFLLAVALPAAAIWKDREIPVSISALAYVFKGGKRWTWTIWLWLTSCLMAAPLMDSLTESWQFMGFLTIICLISTGAMPVFIKEHKDVHDCFGIAAGFFSQVCVMLISPWWLFSWILFPIAFWLYYRQNKIYKFLECYAFIAECLCALALYGSLFTVI